MSEAPGPGWHGGALRSRIGPEPHGEPSQVASESQIKEEDLKPTDHSEDPAYVTLKVKKQVRGLVAAPPTAINTLVQDGAVTHFRIKRVTPMQKVTLGFSV